MPTRMLGVFVAVLLAVTGLGAAPASATFPIPVPVSAGVGLVTVTDLFTYSSTLLAGSLTVGGASYVGEFTIDGFSGSLPPPTALHGENPLSRVDGICQKRFTPDTVDDAFVTASQGVLTGWEIFRCLGRVQGGRTAEFTIHLDVVKGAGPGSNSVDEVGAYHVT